MGVPENQKNIRSRFGEIELRRDLLNSTSKMVDKFVRKASKHCQCPTLMDYLYKLIFSDATHHGINSGSTYEFKGEINQLLRAQDCVFIYLNVLSGPGHLPVISEILPGCSRRPSSVSVIIDTTANDLLICQLFASYYNTQLVSSSQ